jgi:hypothetical protein
LIFTAGREKFAEQFRGVSMGGKLFQLTKICKNSKFIIRFALPKIYIVFDAHMSIASTCIDGISFLFIIFISAIFGRFILHLPNIQLLQGQVIHAEKCRPPQIETLGNCETSSARAGMKSTIMLPVSHLKCDVVCIQNQIFSRSFIMNSYISLQAPCQIFLDPPARVGQPISHSHCPDIHIHLDAQ